MPSESPDISIVMPAYNAAGSIDRAIASVRAQSHANWELLVVDDGSTDGTAATVRAYGDPRIRAIEQENRGASGARNTGVREAAAPVVSLLDADDRYVETHLERVLAFFEAHPDCDLVGSNFHFVYEDGKEALRFKPGQALGTVGDGMLPDYFELTVRERCFPITCGTAFRRARFAELGGFDETLQSFEDQEFYLRWALRARFGYIEQPLSAYHVQTPNSRRKDVERGIRARIELWRKLNTLDPVPKRFSDSFSRCRSFYLFRLTALAIATGNFDLLEEITAVWPGSPRHRNWWLGKVLTSLPRFCQRTIHQILTRTQLAENRYGT